MIAVGLGEIPARNAKRKMLLDLTPSTTQILSPRVYCENYMFLVRIPEPLCRGSSIKGNIWSSADY